MKPRIPKKKTLVFVGILIAIALAGYAAVSSKQAPQKRIVRGLLLDDSNSMQRDDRIARAMIEQALITPDYADRLDVIIVKTGNPETHMEPIVIRELHLEDSGGVIEGNDAVKDAHRKIVEETLEAVLRRSFNTRFSPIDLAISRTLDQMRGAGCGQKDVECTLWVRSDGLETESEFFRRAFERGKVPKKSPPPIDVTSVHKMIMCGWAERIGATKKKRSGAPDDASTDFAMSLWRERLGGENASVVFTPFCPKDAATSGGAL